MGKHLPYNVKCEKQLKTVYNWLCIVILENKIGNMMQQCGKNISCWVMGLWSNFMSLFIYSYSFQKVDNTWYAFCYYQGEKMSNTHRANHLLRSTWCLYKIVLLRGLGRPWGECGQAEAWVRVWLFCTRAGWQPLWAPASGWCECGRRDYAWRALGRASLCEVPSEWQRGFYAAHKMTS